jgi:DNA polymerase elongation subunit (family B)
LKVVYGHTDSIYVSIDSIDKAQEAVKVIENEVRKKFPNVLGLKQHPVVLEFEKYYQTLGVGTTKNRNAGLITWEDGVYLDEPKFTMTGFTAKRVSVTPLEKEVQTNALKLWVGLASEKEVVAYLNQVYLSIIAGKYSKEKLVKRSRLKEGRFMIQCPECKRKYHMKDAVNYKVCGENEGRAGTHKCGTSFKSFLTVEGKKPSIASGLAGVLYVWQHTDLDFDDSYLYLKAKYVNKTYTHPLTKEVREVEYVSGNIMSDFDGFIPDWEHYAEQVVKKAKPIFLAMNWELSSIRTGRIQTSLTEWF